MGSANVGAGVADGRYSMTIGDRNNVGGRNSLAVGYNNILLPTTNNSEIFGSLNYVNGNHNLVAGFRDTITEATLLIMLYLALQIKFQPILLLQT